MPVTCEFDGTALLVRLAGVYGLAELRAPIAAALAEPRTRPLTGVLIDMRESESVTMRTLGDITAIIGFLAYHGRSFGNRVAFLVSGDAQYAVARMATADLHTGGVAASVFHQADEARRWL